MQGRLAPVIGVLAEGSNTIRIIYYGRRVNRAGALTLPSGGAGLTQRGRWPYPAGALALPSGGAGLAQRGRWPYPAGALALPSGGAGLTQRGRWPYPAGALTLPSGGADPTQRGRWPYPAGALALPSGGAGLTQRGRWVVCLGAKCPVSDQNGRFSHRSDGWLGNKRQFARRGRAGRAAPAAVRRFPVFRRQLPAGQYEDCASGDAGRTVPTIGGGTPCGWPRAFFLCG